MDRTWRDWPTRLVTALTALVGLAGLGMAARAVAEGELAAAAGGALVAGAAALHTAATRLGRPRTAAGWLCGLFTAWAAYTSAVALTGGSWGWAKAGAAAAAVAVAWAAWARIPAGSATRAG